MLPAICLKGRISDRRDLRTFHSDTGIQIELSRNTAVLLPIPARLDGDRIKFKGYNVAPFKGTEQSR